MKITKIIQLLKLLMKFPSTHKIFYSCFPIMYLKLIVWNHENRQVKSLSSTLWELHSDLTSYKPCFRESIALDFFKFIK